MEVYSLKRVFFLTQFSVGVWAILQFLPVAPAEALLPPISPPPPEQLPCDYDPDAPITDECDECMSDCERSLDQCEEQGGGGPAPSGMAVGRIQTDSPQPTLTCDEIFDVCLEDQCGIPQMEEEGS